jgi:acyl dehydratase
MVETRTFTMDDQLSFARLSGDFNPMHVDPVAARRLLFGRPVVHGVHALLWGIDRLLAQLEQSQQLSGPVALGALRSSFRSPVLAGDAVGLTIAPAKGGRWKLDVSGNGTALASTMLSLVPATAVTVQMLPHGPPRGECRELKAADLLNAAGRIPLRLDPELAAALFPAASRLLPVDQLATLLASTLLVGMELPGLHSLFTGLELRSEASVTEAALAYEAKEFDDRFSMLTIGVTGPTLSGTLSAALRPTPAAQATIIQLREMVGPGEFAGRRALVIGGSRGLGEVVVKALAAGGAEVRFTYHKGATDAQRIAEEAAAAGASVECFGYDVSGDAARLKESLAGWSPNALYFFATPYIGSSAVDRFSPQMFRRFCDCYVENFLSTFDALVACSHGLEDVFYPSSSVLDEPSPNLLEYSAAKAAGEMLCRVLEKAHPAMRFQYPRLPRLATDQTASLLAVETEDPAVYMLGLLRKFGGRPGHIAAAGRS